MNRTRMLRLSALALSIVVALLLSVPWVHSQPRIEFEELEYDWGEMMEGDTVTHAFDFYNRGTETLVIEKVKSG